LNVAFFEDWAGGFAAMPTVEAVHVLKDGFMGGVKV
jgi:hypothetical protein